jgi:hypothetical protein
MCPICKHKGAEFRIYIDIGNFMSYMNEYERLDKMYDYFIPNRNKWGFGKTCNVYIPGDGSFQIGAEIKRYEIIDLAYEFNEHLKEPIIEENIEVVHIDSLDFDKKEKKQKYQKNTDKVYKKNMKHMH